MPNPPGQRVPRTVESAPHEPDDAAAPVDAADPEPETRRIVGLAAALARPLTPDDVAAAIVREACTLTRAVSARVRLAGHGGTPAQEAQTVGAATSPTSPASTVTLPLRGDSADVGTLELAFAGPTRMKDRDRRALEVLAVLGGLAVERARLHQDLEDRRRRAVWASERASALAALTSDLSSALTPEEVAEAAMERALPAVGATSGSLALLDRTRNELAIVAVHGYPEPVRRSLDRIRIDASFPLAEAVRTRRPIFLHSRAEWSERYPLLEDALGGAAVESIATVPLEVHGRVIGGLRLGFPEARSFGPVDAEYITALADTCAEAIERARLFEAEWNARLTLDTVIGQMPIGVVVAQPPDGRIVLANAQVDRIWRNSNRPSDVLFDRGWIGFGPDGRRLAADAWPLARSLVSGETVEGDEIEIERGDGTRGAILVSSAPVRGENGRIIAAVATFADITERREADAMRDAFVSVLSHELRTPLTSIYGGVQLLRRSSPRVDDATRREVVDDVVAETERLTRLVEDLLVLARVERGVSMARLDPVLLGHLVPRVVAGEQPRWPATRFDTVLPPSVPTVHGDEGYVEQVLRNMLSNAAKYGPVDGRVEVVVETHPEELVVRVRDEGPGIDDAEAAELFRLFYRSPRTASATGAGIGLFVARSLIEAMGGRIWAVNRPDRTGGEFGFALRRFEDIDEV